MNYTDIPDHILTANPNQQTTYNPEDAYKNADQTGEYLMGNGVLKKGWVDYGDLEQALCDKLDIKEA